MMVDKGAFDLYITDVYGANEAQIKRGYERRYSSVKATKDGTSSIDSIHILDRATINDGVQDRTFYATEVRKNLFTNEMFVRWHEV